MKVSIHYINIIHLIKYAYTYTILLPSITLSFLGKTVVTSTKESEKRQRVQRIDQNAEQEKT